MDALNPLPDDTTGAWTSSARWERAATVIAIAASALAAVVLLARLLYGADFSDEAFYAATAYRFAMGARPFIDDLDIHQLAGWLVSPWVRAHLLLFGDTTGIVLSLRVLWALLGGAAAYLWFRALRPLVDWRLALLACTTAFVAIPFAIPAPSYNTLSYFLGSMALALIVAAVGSGSEWVPFVVAGALLGVASVAYPTFAVVALVAVAGAWWLTGSWRRAALVLAGGAAVAAIVLVLIAPYLSHAPRVFALAQVAARHWGFGGISQGGVLPRLVSIVMVGARFLVVQPAIWFSLAAGAIILLRRAVPWWLASVLVASFAFLPFIAGTTISTLLLSTVILFSGAVVISAQAIAPAGDDAPRGRVPVFIVVFGVVCGFVFAVTSSNQWIVLGIGGMCVLAPVVAFLLAFSRDTLDRSTLAAYASLVSVLLGVVVLASMLWTGSVATYHDLPPLQLHSMVRSGPYAGIVTKETTARDTESLWTAMKRYTTSRDIVLSFHAFPAGYLFTTARPAVPLLWTAAWDGMGLPELTDAELASMDTSATRPTIVLRNTRPTLAVRQRLYDPAADRLARFVDQNYATFAEGAGWQLARPR